LHGRDDHACHGVDKVIARAGRVIDAVAAAASGATLKAAELSDKPLMIEQLNTATVERRKQAQI
jgi:hypothetical protein